MSSETQNSDSKTPPDSHSLNALGWNQTFQKYFDELAQDNFFPGRIAVFFQNIYRVYSEQGEVLAKLSGNMSLETRSSGNYPVVGDWVILKNDAEQNEAIIQHLLPRYSKISRKVAGRVAKEQVLATNLDRLFIFTSMNKEFNPRRVERYLALARNNGVEPIVVLTKKDLCEDPEEIITTATKIADGAQVLAISNLTGEKVTDLCDLVEPGKTIAVVGSSGVGKSTFVNQLLGAEVLDTQPVRESDDRGRHTTTHRELIPLKNGGLIIDTPGMRELRIWETQIDMKEAFPDIYALADSCKFNDCRHDKEIGCAVREAVLRGDLEMKRVINYNKLLDEQKELEQQKILHEKITQNRRAKFKGGRKRKKKK